MTRRDSRRAELFRRLDDDSICTARRGEPPSPPPPPPPEEEDGPIWPPRSRYWARFRSLKCMKSDSENSQFGSTQNSMTIPFEQKHEVISGNFAEQGHSSECATQVVAYNGDNSGIGQHLGGNQCSVFPSKPPKSASIPIDIYAAQCAKCSKWRIIPTKEKYEAFRAEAEEDQFLCEKAIEWKPDITCNDPSDINPDATWRWAMDKHNIPQAPPQWERLIRIRGEGGTKFADVYYLSPNGKTLRSSVEVEKYLKDNPQYAEEGVTLSQFSFKAPVPLHQYYAKKRLRMESK
ncbi:hypothetical protein ACP4OV_017965 [Aristida adscensionis]